MSVSYQPSSSTSKPKGTSLPSTSTFSPRESRWWSKNFHLGNQATHSSNTTSTTLRTLSNSIVQSISFHGSQLSLASGPRVSVFQLPSPNPLRHVPASSPVLCCSYRHDHRLILMGGEKGLLKVVDAQTKATLRAYEETNTVRCVAWLRDGKHFASAGDDANVTIRSLSDESTRVLRGHGDGIRALLVAKDCLVSGGYDHAIKVWEGETMSRTMDHGEPVEGLAWLEEGRIAIAAGGRGVRAWDVREGRVVAEDRSHAKTVSALCVANTPGGIRVLTGGLDGLIRVYDRDLNLLHGLDHGSPVSALAFSVDARAIAIGSTDGMVSVRKRQAESVKRTRQKTAYSPLSEGDAIVRAQPKKRKQAAHDVFLRKFRYADALDHALSSGQTQAVYQVLEELAKRRGLVIALSNRDEETLEPVLAYTARYITNPKHAPLLVGVANKLCTIYQEVIGQSPIIDELFGKLRRFVRAELRSQEELTRLMGVIDMIVYSQACS